MKKIYFSTILVLTANSLFSQISARPVPISETFSSNGNFLLRSISYDDEFPNLLGETFVFHLDERSNPETAKMFYKIDRSFDLFYDEPLFVAVSNDGRKIIYIQNRTYYKEDENKNVRYFIDGKLNKSYTTEQFINCDRDKEKCEIFFEKRYDIYDDSSSTFNEYKKDFTEKDKFLYKNYVFNKNDTVFVIDGRKKVTLYDLNAGVIIKNNIDFDSIYPKIKNIEAVKSKISYYNYPYKYIIDMENGSTGEKLSASISQLSGLKFIALNDKNIYILHKIKLAGYLNRSGKFEIETFEADDVFDKEKIKQYLLSTTFKTDFIPYEVDKIYMKCFYGGYRNYDDKIAEEETLKAKEKRKNDLKKRFTLEKIDGVYIPRNLYECMTELDKILNFESKNQLKEAKDSWEFNSHMGGLGMWIRNNWGINGGSRLSMYFSEREVGNGGFGNDEISGIIIEEYIKWLKGDKKSWQKWEKDNPIQTTPRR